MRQPKTVAMPKVLPLCALSYGLSVLLGSWLAVSSALAVRLVALMWIALAIAWWQGRSKGVLILLGFCATGLWASAQRPEPPNQAKLRSLLHSEPRDEPLWISAQVRLPASATFAGLRVPVAIFAVQRSDSDGGCLDRAWPGTLWLHGSPSQHPLPGDLLRVRTHLRVTVESPTESPHPAQDDPPSASPIDPSSDLPIAPPSDLPSDPDSSVFGSAKASAIVLFEPSAAQPCQPQHNQAWRLSIRRSLERLRLHFRQQIASAPGSPEGKATLIALCLGYRGELLTIDRSRQQEGLPTLSQRFVDAGVSHILSVSGLHLALVGWLWFRVLSRLLCGLPWLAQRMATQRLAALLAMPVVVAYTLLTGSEAPTVRAACVLLLWLLAVACGRRTDLAHGLALAVLWMGLPTPTGGAQRLLEPSWLLSLAATLGLGYLRPLDVLWPSRSGTERHARNRLLVGMRNMLSVTLGATLATAPLTAWWFGRFVATGILANCVVVPLGELLILPLSLLGLVVGWPLPLLGTPLVTLSLQLTALFLWLTDRFAQLPLAWTVPAPPIAWLLLYCVGLTLAMLRRSHGYRLSLLAVVFYLFDWQRPHDTLRLSALSVGQGDGLLIELPMRAVLVIDAGPRSEDGVDAGLSVMAPTLRKRGISHIDWLLVTHAHPDHSGGIEALLREFSVKELWLEPLPALPTDASQHHRKEREAAERTLDRLRQLAAQKNTRVVAPHSLWSGPVELYTLPTPQPALLGLNDGSVVTRLRYGSSTLLLTGDIESAREQQLLSGHEALRADVLKAPHHCSRTSSSEPFVQAVAPRLLICSVGRHNRFGFPHAEVVARYKAHGSQILRTDQLGSVTVEISPSGRLRVLPTNKARFFF